MTKGDFLVAYNIGHRDGKEDVYCPNDYDDIFNIEQQSCEDCCNGNQKEKAKLCQKSYIAGMEHNCENEQIIRIKNGTLKARTGRYVIYDVEWLKTHFNTTEAKIYGQPSEDCIRRSDASLTNLEILMSNGDYKEALKMLLDKIEKAPSATPQPQTGHWVWCASSHKCSNCGEYVCFSHKKLLKYCPECGARMETKE